MTKILTIETATKNCSVALFDNDKLLALEEENSDRYSHAEKLNLFVEKVIKVAHIELEELNAVAISMGPGSYTGLRIGTSTVKGLCYALNTPLISISTLKAMAYRMSKNMSSDLFCPMIDARRMEVFAAIFNTENKIIRDIQADIVNRDTYAKYLDRDILFFGDGAIKCKNIIDSERAIFIENFFPSARDLGLLAYEKFKANKFEDIAYFEPLYLKDFVTGKKS